MSLGRDYLNDPDPPVDIDQIDTWYMSTGATVKISHMSDDHVRNVISFLKRMKPQSRRLGYRACEWLERFEQELETRAAAPPLTKDHMKTFTIINVDVPDNVTLSPPPGNDITKGYLSVILPAGQECMVPMMSVYDVITNDEIDKLKAAVNNAPPSEADGIDQIYVFRQVANNLAGVLAAQAGVRINL